MNGMINYMIVCAVVIGVMYAAYFLLWPVMAILIAEGSTILQSNGKGQWK